MSKLIYLTKKEVILEISDKFKELKKLNERKSELNDKLKEVKSEIDELENEIKEWMIDNDTTKMTVEGYTFYIREQLWASVPKSTPPEDFKKLQDNPRFSDLIENDVNTHKLSARLREVKENLDVTKSLDEWLEEQGLEGVVSKYVNTSIGMRKDN